MIDGLQVVGLDIAKLVFQMHTVDMTTGEIVVSAQQTRLDAGREVSGGRRVRR